MISKGIIFSITLLLTWLLVGCGIESESATSTRGDVESESISITATTLPDIVTPIPTINVIESQPAVKEARLLVLEWPPKIRVGDADVIRLTLEVNDEGDLTPTAVIAGHDIRGEVVYIPDVYETHRVIAAARLDVAALQIAPNSLIEQPLLPGEKVDFFWSITTNEIGSYRGTVWLYLRFLPLDGGEEVQKPLTAQVIEINSVNLFGMGGTPARVFGSVGIAIGALLGMDDILSLLTRGYRFLRKVK